MGLADSLSILHQSAEDYAKTRKEALDSQAKAAGNRNLLNTFVNTGIWGAAEVAEYNKLPARGRDEMIASGARAYQIKASQAEAKRAEDNARRAAESIQLERDRMGRHVWEYDQAEKEKAAKRQAAIDFINKGPQVFPGGPAVPGYGQERFRLTNTGDLVPMTDQDPRMQQMIHARELAEKDAQRQKEISESKTIVNFRGQRVAVDPNSKLGEQAALADNPAADAKAYYNLRPNDFFNTDKKFMKRGSVTGTTFEPDANGPMIQVGGAKPMPMSEFEEFKDRFKAANMAPPEPSPTPESGGGGGPWWQNIPGFKISGPGGGAAPSPTPVADPRVIPNRAVMQPSPTPEASPVAAAAAQPVPPPPEAIAFLIANPDTQDAFDAKFNAPGFASQILASSQGGQ